MKIKNFIDLFEFILINIICGQILRLGVVEIQIFFVKTIHLSIYGVIWGLCNFVFGLICVGLVFFVLRELLE